MLNEDIPPEKVARRTGLPLDQAQPEHKKIGGRPKLDGRRIIRAKGLGKDRRIEQKQKSRKKIYDFFQKTRIF